MESYFKDILCSEMRVEENAKEIYIVVQKNEIMSSETKENIMRFYNNNKQICNFLFEILKINLENRIYQTIQKKGDFRSVFESNNEIMVDTKFYIRNSEDYVNKLLLLCLKNTCQNVRSNIEICKEKEYYKLSVECSVVIFILNNVTEEENILRKCIITFFDIKKVESGLFNYFCIFNEICAMEKNLKSNNGTINSGNNTTNKTVNERKMNTSKISDAKESMKKQNTTNKTVSERKMNTSKNNICSDISFLSKIKEEYFCAIISICGTKNIDFTLSVDQYKLNVNESFFGFKEIMTFFVNYNLLPNFYSSYFDSLSKNLIDYILSQENIPIQDSERFSEFIAYIYILYDNYQTLDNYARLESTKIILESSLEDIHEYYDDGVLKLEKDEIVLLLLALFNDTEKRQRLVCKISKKI